MNRKEQPRSDVAIVGAGIAGLATAFELVDLARRESRPIPEIVVFEAATRPGGNIRTEREGGYVCEWGPEGFLDSVPETLDLARRVGLGDRVERARKEADRRYIYRAGALRPVPLGPGPFLFSDILPLKARLRVFCEPLIPARRGEEDESVFDFAARRIGRGAAAGLVDAMVSGVFAGDARRLSLPAAFPRMHAMERDHGGLVRALIAKKREARRTGERIGGPSGPRGTLTSFQGGLETFIEGLAQAVGAERLRLGEAVDRVERCDGGYRVVCASGETWTAKCLVAANAAPKAAPMLAPVSQAIAHALDAIPFASLAVVCLGYKAEALGRPLDGFGFLIPRSEGLKSLGALWSSSAFAGRAPEGRALLRVMIGGATFPEAVDWDDARLLSACRAEIEPILGIRQAPEWTRLLRFRQGIAQFNLGHLEILKTLRREAARFPGLYLAGSSYHGIAMNVACEQAPKAARAIAGFLWGSGGNAGEERVF